jgi:hypothetical protein
MFNAQRKGKGYNTITWVPSPVLEKKKKLGEMKIKTN